MIRAALALTLAAALVAPLGAQSINERIREQNARVHQQRTQLQSKQAQLHTATLRVGNLQAQLSETTHAIGVMSTRLDDLAAQERGNERRLAWNRIQLDAAQASLKRHTDALKRRLVDIYERGDLSYLSVLLAANSFSDFAERWDDIRFLVASNRRAISSRRDAQRRVAAVQRGLESAHVALVATTESVRRTQNQLDALASERRNLVTLADRQRSHVAGEVAQLQELTAAQESSLEALIIERQRQYAAERAAARARYAAGHPGSTGTAGGEAGTGGLSWPVHGTITSTFGWRSSPYPEFHQGLDIAADTGTTISASAAGTVLMAGWYGGYGNYILIDHGGGISTGYGHCSAIFVSVGQQVQRGQAIGAVGSTGNSTGPHLHFEVRVDGKPVDPASRL